MVKCASTALPPSATAAENLNASCGSRKSAECAGCGTGQASHASAAITRRPTRCQGFTDSIFVASPCNPAVKGGLRLTIGAGRGMPRRPWRRCSNLLLHFILGHCILRHRVLGHRIFGHGVLGHSILGHGVLGHSILGHRVLLHRILGHCILGHGVLCVHGRAGTHETGGHQSGSELVHGISQNGLRFKWQTCGTSGAAEQSAPTESVAATRSGFVRTGCSHERRHSDAPTACSTCPVCIFWTKPTIPNSARFQFERSVTARSTSAWPRLSSMGPIHSRTTWSCDKVTPLFSPADTREVILSSVIATNKASCPGGEDAVADAEIDSFPEAVGSAWI